MEILIWLIFAKKLLKHKDNLAALMVTYPSTHGVFEESILEIARYHSRKRRTSIYGWCQYECTGWTYQSGNNRS